MTNTIIASPRMSGSRRMKLERTKSPSSIACYPSVAPPCAKTEIGDGDCTESYYDPVVRFARSVTVRFTRSHHDYTPRQIKDCFYQDYELREIRAKCGEDLQRFRNTKENGADDDLQDANIYGDNDDENDTCCIRGLEIYEDSLYRRKRMLRAKAANRVFDAEDDGCDEITIANEYSEVAARSQTWANIVGLRDQRDAAAIHGE